MMTNSTFAAPHSDAKWGNQKEKFLAKFPALKVEDLEYEEGQWEEMLTRVQLKLGRTEIEMNNIISAL